MQVHIRLEGTAEEVANTLNALSATGALNATALELTGRVTGAVAEPKPLDTEKAFVSTEFAKRALKRLPLSKPMIRVLEALYNAPPDGLSAEELHDVAGYSPQQFAGLMGAFGRRLANTKGHDGERPFFDWHWDEDSGTHTCRLPDSVRKALGDAFPNRFPT